MAEVVHDAPQDFWRSPALLEPATKVAILPATAELVEACSVCATEFMIGAKFCHACGLRRPVSAAASTHAADMAGLWSWSLTNSRSWLSSAASAWHEISLPGWIQYLHFHEIKRWIGLSTASLIAFMIGLGCVAGAIGVSLVYRASNLAEFQAIQMWRIEWLLGATASFVAAILLKKPSENE
jgi:hypothetical protein